MAQDTPRARWRALLLVAAVAAALRLGYVAEVHDRPYWRVPLVDAANYQTRALQVMRGEGLGPEVYYAAPAYPYLLGQIYRVVGPRLEVVYALQMLGGILVGVLVLLLGWRWYGPLAGLAGGLIAGLYGPLVYYENQLLAESAALFLCVLCVALLEFASRRGRGTWAGLGAGTAAGVALQLRPVTVAFLVALLLWLLLQPQVWSARLRRAVLVLAPILLLLLPTLRHNHTASGHWIPISANGGINFFIGNNADYDSLVAIRPGLRWDALTQRFGNTNDLYEWQRGFYRAAFGYMRQEPRAYLALLGKKLGLFWNAREIDRNQDSAAMLADSFALHRLALPWLVVAVLGLVGLVVGWRTAARHPVHGLVLVQMLGVVAFFVTSRYRLVAVPWLALAAGMAVQEMHRAARVRCRRRLLALAAGVGAASLVTVPDFFPGAGGFGRPDFELAEVLARRGDAAGALQAYERELGRHPDDPDVVFRHGEQLERLGQREAALGQYRRAAALAPWSYKPVLSLGSACLVAGDLDGAWAALVEAERRGELHGRVLYDMGVVRERQDRSAEALDLYRRSLAKLDVAEETALRRLGVGRTLIMLGRPEEAEVEFAAAAGSTRDRLAVPLARAEAWLQAGDPGRALAILQATLGAEGDARAAFVSARSLQALGRFEAARREGERAAELDPASALYRTWLQRLRP